VDTVASCRQGGADRRRTRRFVLADRRSGFERRRSACRSPLSAAVDESLLRLRDHPHTLVQVLVIANLLSLLDLALTLNLLRLGVAVEANPLVNSLLVGGATQAALVKTGLVLAASLGIWALRRRRAALTTAVFFLTVYGAVVIYELAGLMRLL
jgi:hypothetical protein